jgi:shikimate dehydrogenase
MRPPITAATVVAGVVGHPVRHSLSPLIHNAWLDAAELDAVYLAFHCGAVGFERLAEGLRGGVARGLNVTLPFKEAALAIADRASPRATAAAAANVLVFEADGAIVADNADGLGLLAALAAQAPGLDIARGPVVVLGAGGAARGAVAALITAGAPQVRVVNRTLSRAQQLADPFGPSVIAHALTEFKGAFADAVAIINATSAELDGKSGLDIDLSAAPNRAVVMDMIYKPLVTPLLAQARRLGMPTVDGLEMLIGQARPSFEAFFGRPPDPAVDVRALALRALKP